jgi:hypothetical protein
MSVRRPILATVVSLCSLVAWVLFFAPAALAVASPTVEEESVLDVASTSATLQATIDPEGSETTYRFEYGTSEAYGASLPIPDGLVGSGSAGVTVSAHLQGLSPSTTYHYRVLALVGSRTETVAGGDGTFTTQPASSNFMLPDGRQWELVSPPNKHGARVYPILEAGDIQASEDGDAITYVTDEPTELEPKGYSNLVQVLSKHSAQGWSSQNIATPHNASTGVSIGSGFEYRSFSPDLSHALVEPQGPFTPLSPEATERTSYVRDNSACEAAPASCYTPLVTAANVLPGAKFGGSEGFLTGSVEFVGSTPELSHVVLRSRVDLTPHGYEGEGGLYLWTAGSPMAEQLEPISLLPDGTATEGELGSKGDVEHAISSGGSRVIWSGNNHSLYMRDTAQGETVELSESQGGSGSGGLNPIFWTANTGDSRVFFTDTQQLTANSTAGEGNPELYVFEVTSGPGEPLAGKLTDLTPEQHAGEKPFVSGVLGASEDGSYVYFVADAALAPKAVAGKCEQGTGTAECNLYVEHYNGTAWEAPTFVAALSFADYPDWFPELDHHTARVSSDGRWLGFMSQLSLTGYDNHDAVSGQPDEEVYLYDARSDHLVCASCNPTGARPNGTTTGSEVPLGAGDNVWSEGTWLAANIPGWTPYALALSVYQSRYLSNNGRLFFNSDDGLAPQDVNGSWDVYEYEPQEVGSCTSASAIFNTRSDGCVDLISSGTSAEESAFMDASESGDDVFFLTTSKLAPQDYDASLDIYDAHVCPEDAPCPSIPVTPPPCDTGDSCKAAPSPQPTIFGAPPSATFSGTGNVTHTVVVPSVKPKSLTQTQKLALALRTCNGKRNRKKRLVCERQARKRYGARQSHKANATKKGGR